MALTPAEQVAAAALDQIMTMKRLTNEQVAERANLKSHQMVQKRRKGTTKMGLQDVKDLADATGVPAFLFDLDVEAVTRWLVDNQPSEVAIPLVRWFADKLRSVIAGPPATLGLLGA